MSMSYHPTLWQDQLPLAVLKQTLFVDWHGVMSNTRFWSTYQDETLHSGVAHPDVIGDSVRRVFASPEVVRDWMRGRTSTEQIVEQYLVEGDDRVATRFLCDFVADECARTEVDSWLVKALGVLRAKYYIVLATDNMDCFTDGIRMREDLRCVFDDYISSSDIGVLKSEDPEFFFGSWMQRKGLDPRRAVLIDDCEENCKAFESLGGVSILFRGALVQYRISELF
jgi:FMN phosphatase YigB (HAD superfamily)